VGLLVFRQRGVALTQESYRTINLFNWSGGVVGRRRNPLRFTEGALAAGENVDVSDGALQTRPGTSLMSSGSLPSGEVMALANVRFPTNESSYLVAQVRYQLNWLEAKANGPTTRYGPVTTWDVANGRMLFFGGGENWTWFNDLWAYDPSADVWTELTPSGTPPHPRMAKSAIYVPSMESMIIWRGTYVDGYPGYVHHFLDDLWRYDCSANTWIEQATTGDAPPPDTYVSSVAYRSHANTIVVLIGNSNYFYELDLNTWIWMQREQTFPLDCDPFPSDGPAGFVYDPVHDTIVATGGSYDQEVVVKTTWTLDLTTATWSQNAADFPSAVGIPTHSMEGVYCSGKMHLVGDVTGNQAQFVQAWTYDIDGDSWNELPWKGDIAPPVDAHGLCLSDTGNLLILAPSGDYEQVWQTQEVCVSTQSSGYGLYACPDHLPTSTGVFTKIYQFGPKCGVCKFATLNDRVVITEGLSDSPLVWGGCMADDASDWMTPKAVLIAQDGKTFYDISNVVCDKDVDTVAQVGGIRTWGAIYICTDMPKVEGFHFEMETPNTGAAGTTASTFHAPMQITGITDVSRQDLKATIVNWHQDSGATGHFTDSSGTRVTIGPGNDRGTWDDSTAYAIGDAVNHSGARYWCILGNTNQTPTNTTYWLPNVPDLVPGIVVEVTD
jgi:Galactose oxidase, central domain